MIVPMRRHYSWENDSMSKWREIKIKNVPPSYSLASYFFELEYKRAAFLTINKFIYEWEKFENHTGIFGL